MSDPILLSVAGNPENQDSGAIFHDEARIILCVCDGAGGISGGREAAITATGIVRQQLSLTSNAEGCVELLRQMDMAVSQDPVAGETTCVIAVIGADEIFGASVGDSGAWLLPVAGEPWHLTRYQQKRPFIGSGQALPTVFRYSKSAGKILVATDGLLKYTSMEKITTVCREQPSDAAARQLIELVRYPSGNLSDDVTVVLGEI